MGKKEDKEDFEVKLKRGFIEEIKDVYDKWWG